MSSERSSIPLELKRKILVEAGHRCAIPTCRHPSVEIHHIIPYAEVKEHTYENLIALCSNCHTRCRNDSKQGNISQGEIDRKSIQMYKQNLIFLSGLLTQFERNVLDYLANERQILTIHGLISIKTLLDLKLVAINNVSVTTNWKINDSPYYDEPTVFSIMLTTKGSEFISAWQNNNKTYEPLQNYLN